MATEKTPDPAPFVPPPPPAAPGVAPAASVAPADMMTEQEKDTSSELHGVGPVSPAEPSPGPVETIEDLGIGPRDPYPEGNPPPPPPAVKDPTR